MADSTRARSGAKSRSKATIPVVSPRKKRRKPRSPSLWLHEATGQWVKKIKGKKYYFGTDKDKALTDYMRDKVAIELTGRRPVAASGDTLTIKRLFDTFLTHKQHSAGLGEMTQRSFDDYVASCQRFADFMGKDTSVETLQPEELLKYRQHLSKTCGPHALGNHVQRIRVALRFAFENGLVDHPTRFGEFKRPAKAAFRRQRASVGSRIIEPPQLWKVLNAADCQLRAMIYLGLNCGFGNSDCGQLPIDAVDLQAAWLEFARPKTGIERRCPMWPETVAAIREWLEIRKPPKDGKFADVLFATKYGQPWYVDGQTGNPLSAEFRKLLVRLKLHRPGLSFYSLRHCFQTVADELGDYVASRRIMGHSDPSIGDTYRERFSDERLRRVVEHVHAWLYPRPTVLASPTEEGGG